MTYEPWSAAWYSGNPAVMCPVGSRSDLEKVIELYKPDYYLRTGNDFIEAEPAFTDEELTLSAGIKYQEGDWEIYKINIK